MTTTRQPTRSLIDPEAVRVHHRDAETIRTPAAVWLAIADLPVLLAEIERLRWVPALTHEWYVNLLAAARATVAADRDGESDPLLYLRDELDAYGQLPVRDRLPTDLLGRADSPGSWEPR